MTFTLAARCPGTGQFGIVISSSSPAVAARCAHARAGVGPARPVASRPRVGVTEDVVARDLELEGLQALLDLPHLPGDAGGEPALGGTETAYGRLELLGLRVLRLETGPELVPAVKLYRSLGYRERGPFGDYADLPCSLFMEKRLG